MTIWKRECIVICLLAGAIATFGQSVRSVAFFMRPDTCFARFDSLFWAERHEQAIAEAQHIRQQELERQSGEDSLTLAAAMRIAMAQSRYGFTAEAFLTLDDVIDQATKLYGPHSAFLEFPLRENIVICEECRAGKRTAEAYGRLVKYYEAAGRIGSDECWDFLDYWWKRTMQSQGFKGLIVRDIAYLRQQSAQARFGQQSVETVELLVSDAVDALKANENYWAEVLADDVLKQNRRLRGKAFEAAALATIVKAQTCVRVGKVKKAEKLLAQERKRLRGIPGSERADSAVADLQAVIQTPAGRRLIRNTDQPMSLRDGEAEAAQWPRVKTYYDVVNSKDFETDYRQADSLYHFFENLIRNDDKQSSASPVGRFLDALHRWALCSDSLGRRNEVLPRLRQWRRLVFESGIVMKEYDIDLLSIAWMHCDSADYANLVRQMATMKKADATELQLAAMLSVIHNISVDHWGIWPTSQDLALRTLRETDRLLDLIGQSHDDRLLMLHHKAYILATALIWQFPLAFCLSDTDELFHRVQTACSYIRDVPTLQQFEQSPELLKMYCDEIDKYRWRHHLTGDSSLWCSQTIVEADRLAKQCYRASIEAVGLIQQERAISSSLKPQMLIEGEGYKVGILKIDYRGIYEHHLDHIVQSACWACGLDKNGSVQESIAQLSARWDEIRQHQHDTFVWEDELQSLVETLAAEVYDLLPMGKDSIASMAYDIQLFVKGYQLRSEKAIGRIIRESGNKMAIQAFDYYTDLRQQLARGNLPPATANSLESEMRSIWHRLRQVSTSFGDYTRQLEASWTDVRDALGPGEVAIEYIAPQEESYPHYYYALVLRHDFAAPKIVQVFCNDNDIRKWGDSIYLDRAFSLWPMGELQDAHTIYVSVAGLLHQTAIEHISDYRGRPMCESYNIYRVSSTREILSHKAQSRSRNRRDRAILFGGISYELDELTRRQISADNQRKGITQPAEHDVAKGVRGALQWDLSGTAQEVKQIAETCRKGGIRVSIYTEQKATEETVKQVSGTDATILHIATHGFYQPLEIPADSTVAQLQYKRFIDKALNRSALLMAGAASTLKGQPIPDNVDDGILTAREIASLDLSGLDLVVLSACETGLGDIHVEGVFGLQRGFKQAGVRSILMSLWKVDDEATRLLMSEFYRQLVGLHVDKRVALLRAQDYLRHCDGGRFQSPRYWAAFVLLDGWN